MKNIYRICAALATALFVLLTFSLSQGESMNIGLILGFTISSFIVAFVLLQIEKIFPNLKDTQLIGIALGILGGLLSGYLLQQCFTSYGANLGRIVILLYLFPVILFVNIGLKTGFFTKTYDTSSSAPIPIPDNEKSPSFSSAVRPKILDTSVIIDGRIMDVAETKFVEGPFIVPNFVLREIQLISDSSDAIKRNRGRRGLDMLNRLQERSDIEVKISYEDYHDIREVDTKLVRISKETGGYLVTNDFNLNKVAGLQGVDILNLNSLTGALKPVVLPGETLEIDILRDGRDENQGIGYMEDGTMVVVESGGGLTGKRILVNVTSVIQTAAGRMIFTRFGSVLEDTPQDPQDKREKEGSPSGQGGNSRSGGRSPKSGHNDRRFRPRGGGRNH